MKTPSVHLERGFTLVEILIVILIFAFIMGALIDLVLGYYTIYNRERATIEVAGSARDIMNEVGKDALQADQVVASHACAGTTYTSGTTTVVFEIPSVDTSGNIISGSFDYACIYQSGSNMYSVASSASGSARASVTKTLSMSLGAISFTYDNSDFTKVTNVLTNATTTETVGNQTVQIHLKERAYLRNL